MDTLFYQDIDPATGRPWGEKAPLLSSKKPTAGQFMGAMTLGKNIGGGLEGDAAEKFEQIADRFQAIDGAKRNAARTTGDYGGVLGGLLDRLHQTDGSAEQGIGKGVGSAILEGMFDLGGNLLAGANRGAAANNAMNTAGAIAEAGNEKARREIINQGNQQYEGLNAANAARGLSLTNSAIGQEDAYGRGMQTIGMSGISGSKNMERNLDYGQGLHEAQQQLQYDLMGREAEQVDDAMAGSFAELSQRKGDAMISAYSNSMGQSLDAVNQTRQALGEFAMQVQPTMADFQELELLMKGGKSQGELPKVPAYTPAHEANAKAAAQDGDQNQADSEYARKKIDQSWLGNYSKNPYAVTQVEQKSPTAGTGPALQPPSLNGPDPEYAQAALAAQATAQRDQSVLDWLEKNDFANGKGWLERVNDGSLILPDEFKQWGLTLQDIKAIANRNADRFKKGGK